MSDDSSFKALFVGRYGSAEAIHSLISTPNIGGVQAACENPNLTQAHIDAIASHPVGGVRDVAAKTLWDRLKPEQREALKRDPDDHTRWLAIQSSRGNWAPKVK